MASSRSSAGREASPADIQAIPWARAYDAVQNQPGTMLFSMARTQERVVALYIRRVSGDPTRPVYEGQQTPP